MEVTRKMLEDYRKIKAEIPLLEYELKEMRLTDAGFGNTVILNGKNGSKKPETVVGFDQARYDHRKAVLQRKKDQAAAVETWLEGIEDGQTRCVLKMFYRDGMSFDRIAMQIGRNVSGDYVRLKIRDKYFKENKIF